MTDISPPFGNYTSVTTPDTTSRYISGRFYNNAQLGDGTFAANFAANRLNAGLVWIEKEVSISELGVIASGMVAGAVCYCGIYTSKDFFPDQLVAISGVAGDLSVGGYIAVPLAVTIKRGWYFLVVQLSDTAAGIRVSSNKNILANIFGTNTGTATCANYNRDGQAMGAFPQTFNNAGFGSANTPIIVYKVA